MGMVFKVLPFFHKTVLENIAFPLQIKGMKTEESISKAGNVKLVGLDGRENYFHESYLVDNNKKLGSLDL